jgi:hypothetical protein
MEEAEDGNSSTMICSYHETSSKQGSRKEVCRRGKQLGIVMATLDDVPVITDECWGRSL